MLKTGIVLSIINKKAGIMTDGGEFVYIRISTSLPKIGEIYRGELYVKGLLNYKYIITAASLMFVLLTSSFANIYYTPTTTLVISINPSVSLKSNKWNKIISFKALNSDGTTILSNIKLKNKSIDAGLELLVKEAKTENFINDKYIMDKKIISIDINGNKNTSIDISNFKNIIDSNDLNIIINNSSSNNKKIDFTVNNKKIDTLTLNHNGKKKDSTTTKENTEKTLPKKSSVDVNTNKVENKSSKIKSKIKNNDKKTKNEDNKINFNDKHENKKSNSDSSSIKKYITPNENQYNSHNSFNKSFQDSKN